MWARVPPNLRPQRCQLCPIDLRVPALDLRGRQADVVCATHLLRAEGVSYKRDPRLNVILEHNQRSLDCPCERRHDQQVKLDAAAADFRRRLFCLLAPKLSEARVKEDAVLTAVRRGVCFRLAVPHKRDCLGILPVLLCLTDDVVDVLTIPGVRGPHAGEHQGDPNTLPKFALSLRSQVIRQHDVLELLKADVSVGVGVCHLEQRSRVCV
mmetsp:Transcript_19784/g.50270  ORF Transcript_19784/g.50270 Transcript_19784/m.50270 type:complete len:210 (-) Transcript_19784:447-1076(-)